MEMQKRLIERYAPLSLLGMLLHVVFDFGGKGLIVHASSTNKGMMNGVLLRTSAFQYPPIFSVKKLPTGNFSYDGVSAELLGIFAKYYNMTLQFVHIDPSEVAKHGIIRSLFHQLDENEVDVSFYFFEMIPANLKHIDISYPAITEQFILLQPLPEEQNRLKVAIRPFDSMVWACLCTSLIAFIVITSLLSFIQQPFEDDLELQSHQTIGWFFYQQVEYVLTIITFQGNYVVYKANMSFRVTVALWLLPTMTILFAYSGVLTSLLTITKLEPTVDTLEELANAKNLCLTIEKDVLIAKQFMSATTGTYKAIGDILRQDPQRLFFKEPVQMLDNVVNHRCAYLGNTDMVKYFINMDLKSTGKCRMTIGRRPLANTFAIFQVGPRRGSRFTKFIDQIFIRTVEIGIGDFLMKKYLPPTNQCRMKDYKGTITRPLALNDLTAAFFVLLTGTAVAVIIFIGELIINLLRNQFS